LVRNFGTAFAVFAMVAGTPFFSALKWPLERDLTVPRFFAVLAAVLFLAAVATVAELETKWKGASKIQAQQEVKIGELEAQIEQRRSHHPKFGEVFAQSLELMLDEQHPALPVNRVVLFNYAMNCKLIGSGRRFDMEVVISMKGRNVANDYLTELALPIGGDNLVLLADLQAKYYDLQSDRQRTHPRLPRLKSHHDGLRKDLALLFDSPGISPYEDFRVELQYTWPSVFNCREDYWFIDNTLFEGDTTELTVELDAAVMQPSDVVAYSYNRITKEVKNCGSIPAASDAIYRFSRKRPERDTYYALCAFGGK
jgi:hypothetical protein